VERKQFRKITQRIKRIWPALITGAALAGGFVPSALGGENRSKIPTFNALDLTYPMPTRMNNLDQAAVAQNEAKPVLPDRKPAVLPNDERVPFVPAYNSGAY
jgi:hypothetical protein